MSGDVFTGLKFKHSNELNTYTTPTGEKYYENPLASANQPKDPKDSRGWFEPRNDDQDKPLRVRLVGEYAAENYGLKFRFRADMGDSADRLYLNYAYVWATMLDKKLKITGGKIDQAVWATAGDQEFHYSNVNGIRLEVTPIEGLNAGIAFNWPADALKRNATPVSQNVWIRDPAGIPPVGYVPVTAPLGGAGGKAALDPLQTLLETSFGVKYTSDTLDIAAGFQLDSDADGGTDAYDGDFPEYFREKFVRDVVYEYNGDSGVTIYSSGKEIRAYIGANIKMVENLTAAIEAEFYNLGAFGGDPYAFRIGLADSLSQWKDRVISPKGLGAIWIDEKIEYKVSDPLKVGIKLHQILFGGKPEVPAGADDYTEKKTKALFKPEFRFNPYLEYKLNDSLTAQFGATYTIKPTYYKMKLELKPVLVYAIGPKAELTIFYKLNVDRATKYVSPVVELDSTGTFTGTSDDYQDPKAVLTNQFQIDMKWSF